MDFTTKKVYHYHMKYEIFRNREQIYRHYHNEWEKGIVLNEDEWLTPPEISGRLEALLDQREQLLAQLAQVEDTLWEEFGILPEE